MFQIWEYFGKYLNKGNSNNIVNWATGSRNRGIFGPIPPPLDRDLRKRYFSTGRMAHCKDVLIPVCPDGNVRV